MRITRGIDGTWLFSRCYIIVVWWDGSEREALAIRTLTSWSKFVEVLAYSDDIVFLGEDLGDGSRFWRVDCDIDLWSGGWSKRRGEVD